MSALHLVEVRRLFSQGEGASLAWVCVSGDKSSGSFFAVGPALVGPLDDGLSAALHLCKCAGSFVGLVEVVSSTALCVSARTSTEALVGVVSSIALSVSARTPSEVRVWGCLLRALLTGAALHIIACALS